MKKQDVIQWFNDNDLNPSFIDFYILDNKETGEPEEYTDSHFGTCQISGVKGNLVSCYCLTNKNERIHLWIGDWLVNGHVGKLAGAF